MKITRTLLILSFAFIALSIKAQKPFNYHKDYKKILKDSQNPNSERSYAFLMNRFVENDSTLNNSELIALQIGHTATKNYKPYLDLEIERAIFDLNASGKYRASLELSNSFQKRNPLSLMLNLEKSYSLHKLDMNDSSRIYYNKYRKLCKSILSTGDGHDNPYFIIGPIDGQIIIERYWGNQIEGMATGQDNQENLLDVLTMKDKKNNKVTIVNFYIEHVTETMFSEKERENMRVKQKKKKQSK